MKQPFHDPKSSLRIVEYKNAALPQTVPPSGNLFHIMIFFAQVLDFIGSCL
jgi:hypothetical protein